MNGFKSLKSPANFTLISFWSFNSSNPNNFLCFQLNVGLPPGLPPPPAYRYCWYIHGTYNDNIDIDGDNDFDIDDIDDDGIDSDVDDFNNNKDYCNININNIII